MAIGTYSQLKTAIETWLARAGDTRISGNAADMITLCEAYLNRELPLRTMWINTPLTGSVGSSTLTLPTDYLEPQSLMLTTFGINEKLGEFLAGEYEIGTTNSRPSAWAIAGSTIQLDVPCDQAHTFTFRYRQRFALSDASPTNTLLTNHPDVYLFCALVEAEALTKDVSQKWIALWKARAEQAVASVAELESRSFTAASLRVDPAIASPGGFNILTGE